VEVESGSRNWKLGSRNLKEVRKLAEEEEAKEPLFWASSWLILFYFICPLDARF